MTDPMILMTMASFGLTGLSIATFAGLRGWQGWLDLKRFELTGQRQQDARSPAMDRIEMADLKERIRKLESIAACVDLWAHAACKVCQRFGEPLHLLPRVRRLVEQSRIRHRRPPPGYLASGLPLLAFAHALPRR